jgi:hypothetical protein
MWQKISLIIKQLTLLVRVGFEDETVSEWSKWLTFPSDGYAEIQVTGPFLIRKVSYIEINPIEIRRVGRLVPDREIDHSKKLEEYLTNAEIEFDVIDTIYRINF